MSELRDILQGRHDRLATSLRDAAEFDELTAVGTVKRRRRTRALVTSTSTVLGVGALSLGAFLLLPGASDDGDPAATLSPSPTPTVTASPSASPTTAPSAPPEPSEAAVPLVTGDDIGILERLENPTTGETWHQPTLIAAPAPLADEGGTFLSVGTRGDADIVLWVAGGFDYWTSGYEARLYEIDAAGIRWIQCPSVVPSDRCETPWAEWENGARSFDALTNYDSLTLPRAVSPAPGWSIDLTIADDMALLGNEAPGTTLTPNERAVLGYGERTVIATLGPWQLVQDQSDGFVPSLIDVRYRLVSAFGTSIELGSEAGSDYADANAAFGGPNYQGDEMLPASGTCFRADETIDPHHDADGWVAAGINVDGQRVYLPVEGGNAVSRAVYDTLFDSSWAWSDEAGDMVSGVGAYAYSTYAEFLEARSVVTWDRGDGVWVVGIQAQASQQVYECA
ncbi:hypothetical protein [Demequina zhanjiangensis]|uniref:Uncharacterized protein n=1 Tax=Demequina zhanjiangensis TaxID=3051659 RepID=A0ABT8G5W7_9MICO|nr:hypothetical protein [Demequina sp. SYSU T00b26]MDN4474124.1 hypothetical protein [Demequina sp. SYSU T00b26]